MTIERTNQNGITTFSLAGRLDTTTSPQLHETLLPAIDGSADILLDMTDLVYISSAGLRVLLDAQKQATAGKVSMKLKGVSPEIMDVLDMTGFTDILTIC